MIDAVNYRMMHVEKTQKKNRWKKLLGAGILFTGLLLLFFWNPEHIHPVSCLFHEVTGLSCPTCGMTRSLYAVSHGYIGEAYYFHPLGPILYLACVLLFLKFSFEFVTRREIRITIRPRIVKAILLSVFILWAGFWIFRLLAELP